MEKNKHTALVLAIKSGNGDAFAKLFSLEFRNVKFFAHQYLNNMEQAEDVAQETFLSLWGNRTALTDSSNLKALLLTIAKNKSLNVLRLHVNSKTDSLERPEIMLNIKALSSSYIENQIDATSLSEAIEQASKELPEHVRTSFNLSRLENRTYEEIAKIKGITVKSVEYHISLALKHFRRRLAQFASVAIVFYFFSGCFVL